MWDANIPSRVNQPLEPVVGWPQGYRAPSSLLPIRVQARCISSERHVKAWPRTSGPLSPYTLRKYGACGSDLAQHGRDRIDPGELFPNGVPGNGGRDVADGLFECHTHPGAASGHEAG